MADAAISPAEAPPGLRKKLFRIFGLALVIIAIAVGIWYFIVKAGREETDNAYVGADTAIITPLVSGAVAQVQARGMQRVKMGDILMVIDPSDARLDYASAQAALRQAEQRYRQTGASVGASTARATAQGAAIAQSRARLGEADAAYEKARLDLSRRESLVGSGAVSAEEVTAARASFASAKAAHVLAQAGIATAEATRFAASQDTVATAAMISGTTIATAPDVAVARARLDKAQLDLDRTIIRSPIDGIVTNKQIQVGQRVQAGAPVMMIVPVDNAFVDANFKESQFREIRIGQPVQLVSDFYGSGVVYHGKIIGFAGGTGSAFALIPAQNATGNWVKVVQRLPVRIALDPAELKAHPLRVGLSMSATVDTRGR
ncbi:MAG: hypothetical protein RL367_1854 [Pseudomonadota bacterium]